MERRLNDRRRVLAGGLAALAGLAWLGSASYAAPPIPAGSLEAAGQIGQPASTGAPEGFSPSFAGCGGATAPVVNAVFEDQVAQLTNEARLANGVLPPCC